MVYVVVQMLVTALKQFLCLKGRILRLVRINSSSLIFNFAFHHMFVKMSAPVSIKNSEFE